MADSKPSHPDTPREGFAKTLYDSIVGVLRGWMFEVFKHYMAHHEVVALVNELVVCFTSTILSTCVLFGEHGITFKMLGGVNLIASLHLVLMRLSQIQPGLIVSSAMEYLYDAVETFEYLKEKVFPNADDDPETANKAADGWFTDLGMVVTCLCSAILAGFGFSMKGFDGVGNIFRNIHFTKMGTASLREIIDSAIEVIVGKKVDPLYDERKEATDLCDRMSEILRMTLAEIASSADVQGEILTLLKQGGEILASPGSQMNAMKSHLGCLMRALNKRHLEAGSIPGARQETTGVFLFGEAAVGKSALVQHFASILPEYFERKPGLHNLKATVNFCEPYMNEAIGVCDEWNSTVEKNTFANRVLSLCAGDPHNMESAYEKRAPCNLESVFITTNCETAEVPELKDHSIVAFWTRFFVFRVWDPLQHKIVMRKDVDGHRKPDFSHLRFDYMRGPLHKNDPKVFTLVRAGLSIFDVLDMIKYKMAARRKDLYERKNTPIPVSLQPKLEAALNLQPGTVAYDLLVNNDYVPNNGDVTGRQFLMVRLQGSAGSGKTHMATWLAQNFRELTKGEFNKTSAFALQISSSFEQFVPRDDRCVYVFDDWVNVGMSGEQSAMYVTRMNQTHPHSIFILTTNDVLPRTDWRWHKLTSFASYFTPVTPTEVFDATMYDTWYAGALRRIGLQDGFYHRGKITRTQLSCASYTLTTCKERVFTDVDGDEVTYNSVLQKVKAMYISMLTTSTKVDYVYEQPADFKNEVDIYLYTDTAERLLQKLATSVGAASLFLKPNSDVGLVVSQRIKDNINSDGSLNTTKLNVNDFVLSDVMSRDIDNDEKIVAIATTMASKLMYYWRDATFRCVIKDTQNVIYFEKNIIYIYKANGDNFVVEGENLVVLIGERIVVDPKDFAHALFDTNLATKFKGSIENITPNRFFEIKRLYHASLAHDMPNAFTHAVFKELSRLQRVNTQAYMAQKLLLTQNKLAICVLGCAASATLGLSAFGMFHLWRKLKYDKIFANAFANVGSTPPRTYMEKQSSNDTRHYDGETKERVHVVFSDKVIKPDRSTLCPEDEEVITNSEQSEKAYKDAFKRVANSEQSEKAYKDAFRRVANSEQSEKAYKDAYRRVANSPQSDKNYNDAMRRVVNAEASEKQRSEAMRHATVSEDELHNAVVRVANAGGVRSKIDERDANIVQTASADRINDLLVQANEDVDWTYIPTSDMRLRRGTIPKGAKQVVPGRYLTKEGGCLKEYTDTNVYPHEHVCRHCGHLYSHVHFYRSLEHSQYSLQCPNAKCMMYHKGNTDGKQPMLIADIKGHVTLHSPLSLAKLMGPEYAAVDVVLHRIFATLSNEMRGELYDHFRTEAWREHRELGPIVKIPALHIIADNMIMPNMLARCDMISTASTELQKFHTLANARYVRVSFPANCYAIHYRNDYFVTVAHSFNNIGEQVVVQNNGNPYAAHVVVIDRSRDIAIIKTELSIGLKKSRHLFTRHTDDVPVSGAFLRCGPEFEMAMGTLEYRAYQEFLDGMVYGTENYCPSVDVLRIHAAGMKVKDAVRDGDCGFPFVGRTSDGLRILGIHNAYKYSNTIYGAFVTQHIIDEMLHGVVPNSSVTHTSVVAVMGMDIGASEPCKFSMPMEYHHALTNLERDKIIPPCHLQVLGFAKNFYSRQKLVSKHKTHSFQLKNPRMTLPAAVNMAYVEDKTDVKLNALNEHMPLLSEVLKYGIKTTTYDASTFEEAVNLAKDLFKFHYGDFKTLTEHEVINGFKDGRRGVLPSIAMNTGGGLFLKTVHNVHTKQSIFVNKGTEANVRYEFADNLAAQDVRNHYKNSVKLFEEQNITPLLLSQDTAKVEMLPAEKARKGKVRLFNVLDVSVNMFLKRIFGGLVAKIMKEDNDGWIAMGRNPYNFSTELFHKFAKIDGNIVATDMKAYDKTIQKALIRGAVQVMLAGLQTTQARKEEMITALTNMLSHAVHSLNGSMYIVNQGNESGSFVTTLLNSVSLIILSIYSFLRAWKKNPATSHITVTLKELLRHMMLMVLGDDRVVKFSKALHVTMQDLVLDAEAFGMQCTPAKDSEDCTTDMSFCSRELIFDPKDQVVYPKLKKSSVTGLLYWFASFTPEQIIQNFSAALYEAALHDEQFYDDVRDDVWLLCKEFMIDARNLPFTTYQGARARHRSGIFMDVQYEQISALADRRDILTTVCDESERYLKAIIQSELSKSLSTSKRGNSEPDTYESIMAGNPHNNPINRCLELLARAKETNPIVRFEQSGQPHCPTYTCYLDHKGREFIGEGPSKISAKTRAFELYLNFLESNIVINASRKDQVEQGEKALREAGPRYLALTIEAHIEAAIANSSGKKVITIISRRSIPDDVEHVGEYCKFFDQEHCYFLSQNIPKRIAKNKIGECYLKYPGTRRDVMTGDITLHLDETEGDAAIRLCDATEDDLPDMTKETVIEPDLTPQEHIMLQRIVQARSELEILKQQVVIGEAIQTEVDEMEHQIVNMISELPIHMKVTPNSTTEAPMIGVIPNNDPTTAPTAQILDSDKNLIAPVVMNDSGPSNAMLSAGGITFDLHDLCFNQFVASPAQKTISDSAVAGTIIAQVPYDVLNNEFTNPYMQNWVLQHTRFTGDWLLKITCPGNPGLTCSLGAAWSPKKITTTTVDLAEMTKYAYFTESVSTSVNQTLVMRDARSSQFYREVVRKADSSKSHQNQMPHIIIYLETPAQSVFTEKKSTYLTFFTRFASPRDVAMCPSIKPFVVADPLVSIKYDTRAGYTLNF